MCVHAHMHACSYPQSPEESTGVTGSGQLLPDLDTGDRTSVLWKSSIRPYLLSCPKIYFYYL